MKLQRSFGLAAATGVVLLLAGCNGDVEEDAAAVTDDEGGELSSQIGELDARVAELESERDALIVERDSLRAELDDALASSDEPASPSEDDTQGDLEFVEVGDTVRFDDWDLAVTDVTMTSSIDRTDPPRGSYLVLTLDVANEGAQPRSFLGGLRRTAILVDPESERQYEFDSTASLGYYQSIRSGTWHLDDIGPGLSDSLPLVFDVPDDLGPLVVFAVVAGDQGSSGVIIEP